MNIYPPLLDIPTQDPELMMEVRTFESEGLKSVPQQRKNLNPVSNNIIKITFMHLYLSMDFYFRSN